MLMIMIPGFLFFFFFDCFYYIPISGVNDKFNLMLKGKPKILVLNKKDLCDQDNMQVCVIFLMFHLNIPQVFSLSLLAFFHKHMKIPHCMCSLVYTVDELEAGNLL